MFSLMGNCVSCIRKKQAAKRPLTLAILGLDNAGKTTTTKGFIGGPIDRDIAPTVGYSFEKFAFDKYYITLFDLGGGRKIRGIWQDYLHEIYGMIYVVDSSAGDRMDEVRVNLQEILDNSHIQGKPVLLLANKQDKDSALDEVDICEQLNLENVVNTNKCPCRIETCSAIRGAGKKMDKSIKSGMTWMMSVIEKDFNGLKKRVDDDMKEKAEKRGVEKEERRKRVAEKRREREEKEDAERERLGMEEKNNDNDDDISGDPFKKLDANELKKKGKKLKEEKRKKKELLQNFEEEEKEAESKTKDGVEMLSTPRIARSPSSLSSRPSAATPLPQTNSFSSLRSSVNPLLPPQQKPLGTKFVNEPGKRKKKKTTKASVEEAAEDDENLTESINMKSLSTISKLEVLEKTMDTSRSEVSQDTNLNNCSRSQKMKDNDSHTEDNHHEKIVKRKKKRKPTYNMLSESEEDDTEKENEHRPRRLPPPPYIQVPPPSISQTFDDDVTPPSSYRRKKKNHFLKKRAGTSDDDSTITPKYSARKYNSIHAVKEYVHSHSDKETGDSDEEIKGQTRQTGIMPTNKWGLIEELPEVSEDPRRLTANLNSE